MKWFAVDWIWCSEVVRGRLDMLQLMVRGRLDMVQLRGSRLTGYNAVKWFAVDRIWCS